MSPVLSVQDLSVHFESPFGDVHAVRGVSFDLERGETLGIVGESGSGKSVTCLTLMGLLPSPPAVVDSGRVLLDERDLLRIPARELRRLRGSKISMIFQDPMTALNPLLTVGRQLTEVLEVHEGVRGAEARRRCAKGLGEVGVPDPEQRLDAYPHELSGGLRQRVMIAMALLCNPAVLIADEPTTALDVTIQAQVLELLAELQELHGTAIILITHDLGVVAGQADRVNVMYAGRLIETAQTDPLFERPLHPYTRGLIRSIPRLDSDPEGQLFSIDGQPPDLSSLGAGCPFQPRCEAAVERCEREDPELDAVLIERERSAGESNREPRRTACFEWRNLADREGGLA